MTKYAAVALLLLSTPAFAQEPTVNKAMFEPVYRAAKAVQGATASGVTYQKFGELLQAFSTELGIVNDQKPTGTDGQLQTLFADVLEHYQASHTLWGRKISSHHDMWKGYIPIIFPNAKEVESKQQNEMWRALATKYELPTSEHGKGKLQFIGVPGDAPQLMWAKAAERLEKATDLYYGR